jgi:hypothetical protein
LLYLLITVLFMSTAQAGQILIKVVSADGSPLPDAPILVSSPDHPAPEITPGTETVDQIDKQFEPYVKVIRVNTYVRFPNNDDIRHHVYSFSPANRFELPLYNGTTAEPVFFGQAGVVVLGCNIHDWMIGYIYVTDAQWFSKTGSAGTATIDGLPPGRYNVHIWHPLMIEEESSTRKDVTLSEQDTVELSWSLALKPDLRPRRTPVNMDGGYR